MSMPADRQTRIAVLGSGTWGIALARVLSLNGHSVIVWSKFPEEAGRLDITVRWSSETAAVNSKQYRILLGERIYNIIAIDEMGFRHNSRKFFCQLVER